MKTFLAVWDRSRTMDLVRRNRSERGRPLARVRDEMGDLFGRFLEDWGDWSFAPPARGTWWPALDVGEHDEAVVVKAELPGMQPKDIDISVRGNTLTISGEKAESREEKDEAYYHAERRYGTFRREIGLPAGVDADKVEANYKDGVLTVTMPKSEEAKPKRVTVKS